jgi:hydroxypyruvate isomerase
MLKLAANLTMMFNERPFPDRFGAAAAAGFTAVEFLFPYEHPADDIGEWLTAHRLQNVLFNLPPGDWTAGERGLACLPGREQEFHDGVARALEYAIRLGTPRVHALAGVIPAGIDRAACRAVYIDNLRAAADVLAKHDRTLLIEPLNHRDMPGYFLTLQAEAHAVRREVNRPNVLVQMDFYHAQISEGDVATKFKTYFDAIGHVQIAGVPGRQEPDRGELDYAYVLSLIDELGYTGWVGCEYRPRGRTEDGLAWIATLRARGASL